MKAIYNKTTLYAGMLYLILVTPIGIVHELGHAAVCKYENLDVQLKFVGFGIGIKCSDSPKNFTLFTASGGLSAMLTSLVPLLFLKKYKIMTITFLSLATIHGINAIVETVLYDSYIRNPHLWMIILNTINITAFVGFLFKFNKENKEIIIKK